MTSVSVREAEESSSRPTVAATKSTVARQQVASVKVEATSCVSHSGDHYDPTYGPSPTPIGWTPTGPHVEGA
jgi:hypothetical protein